MKALRYFCFAAVAALFACTSPIGQTAETNGARAVGDLPELVVTNVRVTDFTSTSISYSYTVKNLGTVAVAKPQVAVQGYISIDQTIGGGDVAAGGRIVDVTGYLQPGESVNQTGSCGFPGSTVHPELGTQYLILEVDAGNQVVESDETNNLGVVPILPKLPDLVITNVTVDDYTATSISYSWDISNVGLLPANKAQIVVQTYVSSDTAIGSGDVASGGRIVDVAGQILPGETIHMTFSASVPAGSLHPHTSTQYLLVQADAGNQVSEQIETNNLANAVIVPRLPDLILTDVTVDDYTSSSISYSWTIKNVGNKPANKADAAVQAYVSADQFLNAGDAAAGGRIVDVTGQILPGESVRVSFSASVPAGALHPETSTQYLLLVADSGNQILELDETNNLSATLIVPRLPDLIVTDARVDDYSGNTISYSWNVKNVGTRPANKAQVVIQAYVSADQIVNAGDSPAGGRIVDVTGQILPGETIAMSFSASVPAGALHPEVSTQYLLLVADAGNQVLELNETNNVASTLIVPRLPDLVVTDVTAIASETSIWYSFTVRNVGNRSADTRNVIAQAYVVSDTGLQTFGKATRKAISIRSKSFVPIFDEEPVSIPAGGFVLGPFGTTQIAAGASASFTFEAGLPAHWQNANVAQSLQIGIDESQILIEGDESNNVGSFLIHAAGETTF